MLPASKADDAPVTAEDLLFDMPAEADPVLDLLLNPGQFDMGQRVRSAEGVASLVSRKRRRAAVHQASPEFSGNSRVKRSRSMSATVTPRRKAATLMRPRSSGVTSMVRRAVKVSALNGAAERKIRRLDPTLGVAWPGSEAAFQIAAGHRAILSISAASAAISRAAGLFGVEVGDEAAGAGGVSEGDALSDHGRERPADRDRPMPRRSLGQ